MHPERLVAHLREVYTHDKFFQTNRDFSLINSYYHTSEMQFPIGMHSHTFFEVNVIAAGQGYHYIDQQCIQVCVGDVFVLPPSVRHGYYTDDPTFKILHILISSAFMERYKSELHALPGYSILFETEPFIRSVSRKKILLSLNAEQFEKVRRDLDELVSYEDSDYGGNEIQKIAKTLYLLGYFSELIHNSHKIRQNMSREQTETVSIVHTMEYIQSNYHEKISIETLAKIALMSRSTYFRQFKKLCKCTPQQYLTEVRISKATEMLENTDRSITEISQNCGFFDSSHFSHIFYAVKGIYPSQVRKNKEAQNAANTIPQEKADKD